jgi:hypothetical protein
MMSDSEKKVYDYDAPRVRDQLVDVFKKRKGEATTTDLIALTGLPKAQVEAEIQAVSDEYGARLRVTDSGEILYSFPSGMRSRYRGFGPGFKRGWKAFRKVAGAIAAFAFKIWVVVMLVGYFVFFIALAIMALLASVAISASGNSSDSRSSRSDSGGGLGGLFITGRLLNTLISVWFYSELFMTPEQRNARAGRKRERKPLYKAIYSFVFGDGDPDSGWDTLEKKAFIAFAQANKGIVTMPEFMSITGLGPLEAEARINRFLYEFEGSPEVTEGGTIYYSFPSLLRRKDKADRTFGNSVPMKRIAPFSSNAKKANRTFLAFNGVNVLFGTYFFAETFVPHGELLNRIYTGIYASKLMMVRGWDGFYFFTHQLFGKLGGMADPTAFIGFALGAVPLAFSVFFFAIPAIRSRRLAVRNERARNENLRRIAYRAVLDSPSSVRPESITPYDDAARPKDGRAAERALTELAAWSGAEPRADGSFSFAEIERGKAEAAKARAEVDLSKYELGGVAFDSDAPAR